MKEKCTNCGGELLFSPKDKGTKCVSCGSVFPIKYNFKFEKNEFDDITLEYEEISNEMETLKCKSCGASVVSSKFQVQNECPYCGSTSIAKARNKKMMAVDSVIPFAFSKADAVNKFNAKLKKSFFANKNVFRDLTEKDVNGTYCNAFVFDFATTTKYSGVFSYQHRVEDGDGVVSYETIEKNVSGTFKKNFSNISIEANANMNQMEFVSILPYDYRSAVAYDDEFMHGYVIEYQDKAFSDALKEAEKFASHQIKKLIMEKHGCDHIITLNYETEYTEKKYDYCLLPMYLISKTVNDKKYKVVMNGQTGKISPLPKNILKIILTLLPISMIIVGIIVLLAYTL